MNPVDVKLCRGDLAEMFPAEFPVTPGSEAAGTIDAVGDGVSGTAVGDAVLGITAGGAHAEYALLASLVL